MKKKKACYFCNDDGTTKEHAIPRAFRTSSEGLTENLIKVPSCVVHNNNKSEYDDLISTCFLMTTDCNSWCQRLRDNFKKRSGVKYLSQNVNHINGSITITAEMGKNLIIYIQQMSATLYYKKYQFSEKLMETYPEYVLFLMFQIDDEESYGYQLNNEPTVKSYLQDIFTSIPITYNNGEFCYKSYEINDMYYFEMKFYNHIKIYTGFSKTKNLKFLSNIYNV